MIKTIKAQLNFNIALSLLVLIFIGLMLYFNSISPFITSDNPYIKSNQQQILIKLSEEVKPEHKWVLLNEAKRSASSNKIIISLAKLCFSFLGLATFAIIINLAYCMKLRKKIILEANLN